jgi:hypothetical protein
MLGVRCIQQELSVAIGDASLISSHKWDAGDSFEIKFRADDKPVLERAAQALNERVLQIEDSEVIMDQLAGSKEAAFRVSSGADISFDFAVPVRQADKVVAIVKKACGK